MYGCCCFFDGNARESPERIYPRSFWNVRRRCRSGFTCVILLILFIIFWLPFFILALVQHYFGDQLEAPKEVTITIYYLRLFSSLFNPIIYTLRKPDLKKAARGIYRKVFPCNGGIIRGKEGTSNHALDDFQPQCETIPLQVVHEGSWNPLETFENAKILAGSGSHYENHLRTSCVQEKKTEEMQERSI